MQLNLFSDQDIRNECSTKKLENSIQANYYWRSDADPFSDEKNAKWQAYGEEDNITLEEAYQIYSTKKGPKCINLQKSNYKIDFSTLRQISLKDSKLQRPIKRTVNEVILSNEKKYEQQKQKKLNTLS